MRPLALALLGLLLAPAAGQAASVTFSSTGAEQTFTVPPGVTTLHVRAQGADGAAGWRADAPGRGAIVEGSISVTPGQTLYVEVGGEPTTRPDCEDEPVVACLGASTAAGTRSLTVAPVAAPPMCAPSRAPRPARSAPA
jgi:hypothetical protein